MQAFECQRQSIFQNRQLSMAIKKEMHHALVLPALLYGAETWTVMADWEEN